MVEWLARAGLVAKGVSFGIVGVLAVKLAAGDGGKATSRQGALQTLAHHSLGKTLLIALAAGFAAYALWRFVEAATADKTGARVGSAARGAIYAGLTYTTLKIVAGAGAQPSQSQKAHHAAAAILGWPAGRWLVGIAGLAVVGAGCWNLYRGVTKRFEKKWDVSSMSAPERRWGGRAGVAGHVARFVVFALIGGFVIKAAVQYDPKEAIGLDGALAKLAQQPYGPWLLGVTAAGLVAYAVFCLVDARYRKVESRGLSPQSWRESLRPVSGKKT